MLKGAELAAAQLNARDGILGKQVQIVPIDDGADPALGVKAAKAAIAGGLDGIVGPYNSGVGVETLPLYIHAGLVPIRLTSDNSTNGLGFTLQPMTYQIAPVASEALTDWLGAKTVAIAYDPTQNYTVSVSKELKGLLEKAGVTVTAYEKVQPGKKSYTDVVKKLAVGKPDVIYAAVYFPEGGLIAKEMHEGNVGSQCIADYGSYDTGFVETAGVAAAQACPVVGVPAPEDFSGAASKVGQYRDEFGQAPGTWSPYTYDSLNFLARGVEEAHGAAPKKLTDALDGVKGRKGWTGSITIDPDNGNRRPATVVIVGTDAKGQLHVDEDWAKAVGAPYRR
jgi:branched-chain amino acid transport system substrate-binding protein